MTRSSAAVVFFQTRIIISATWMSFRANNNQVNVTLMMDCCLLLSQLCLDICFIEFDWLVVTLRHVLSPWSVVVDPKNKKQKKENSQQRRASFRRYKNLLYKQCHNLLLMVLIFLSVRFALTHQSTSQSNRRSITMVNLLFLNLFFSYFLLVFIYIKTVFHGNEYINGKPC